MNIYISEQHQTPQAVLQREQEPLVRSILRGLIVLSIAGTPVTFLAPVAVNTSVLIAAIVLLIAPVSLGALRLLANGRFRAAVIGMVTGLMVVLAMLLIITGVFRSGALLFGFSVPIVLSGLLLGRRAMQIVVLLCCVSVLLVLVLQIARPDLIGIAESSDRNLGGIAGGFIIIAVILGLVVVRFTHVFHSTLALAYSRERELQTFRDSLERTVEQRTAALQAALTEVEERTREQSRLYAEHLEQQLQLRQMSVPVLPIAAHTLVVPLVGAVDSERLNTLSERTLHAIASTQARTVILDITGVPVVDEIIAHGLIEVVDSARLLGAHLVLVGVRPEVAQSIVSGGIALAHLQTFSSLQQALEHLRPVYGQRR